MKKRNAYQLPRNWRKVKRALEYRLGKNNELKTNENTIFEAVYQEEWRLIQKIEKLQKEISHRYEDSYVNHRNRLITRKDNGYAIEKCPSCYAGSGKYSLNIQPRSIHGEITCCVFCAMERRNDYKDLLDDYHASIL